MLFFMMPDFLSRITPAKVSTNVRIIAGTDRSRVSNEVSVRMYGPTEEAFTTCKLPDLETVK